MKTKNLQQALLCLLIGMATSFQSYGDGVLTTWSNCNRDNGNKGNNYCAAAYAWAFALYGQDIRRACNQQTSLASIQRGNWCAYQEAECGPIRYHLYGYVKKRICGRGMPSMMPYLMQQLDDSTYTDTSGREESQIDYDGVSFNQLNNTITLSNIHGFMSCSMADFKSEFKIVIWKPRHENDTVPNDSNTKWTASASLVNGQLQLFNLNAADFLLSTSGATSTVTVNNFSKSIAFPAELNVGGLAVSVISDGRDYYAAPMNKVVTATEKAIDAKDISMKVYPNPAVDQLFVSFSQKENTDIQIYILDMSGRLVKQIPVSSNGSGVYNFSVDLAHLSKGVYTISILSGKRLYMKQFVKD